MSRNRLGVAPANLKCARSAPTMRPLSPETGSEVNPWAKRAPTMRPLCPVTVLELNRWALSAPTMRPLGAH
jgi:hypothetical protein